MNKLFLSAVSVFAIAGIAVAADSTQFGVLKVPSTAAQTIVSVPWLESTTTDKAVAVSNLVLTAGLTKGDTLKWYDSSAGDYKVWTLVEKDGVKYWSSPTMVSGSGADPTADPATQGIARGQAIILTRSVYAEGFYIMGKPATTTAEPLTLPNGSMKSPVWALIAPPNVGETDVNSGLSWANLVGWSDQLIIYANGVPETLTWTGSMWASQQHSTGKGITIPAGQGAWFCGRGTAASGNKTVSWTK